jgi:hypothetical protein
MVRYAEDQCWTRACSSKTGPLNRLERTPVALLCSLLCTLFKYLYWTKANTLQLIPQVPALLITASSRVSLRNTILRQRLLSFLPVVCLWKSQPGPANTITRCVGRQFVSSWSRWKLCFMKRVPCGVRYLCLRGVSEPLGNRDGDNYIVNNFHEPHTEAPDYLCHTRCSGTRSWH